MIVYLLMRLLKIILCFTISVVAVFYGLGQMVNKKYNVDELYWQAEGKTSSEQGRQDRIRQLDDRGRNYVLKYTASFAISIVTFIVGMVLIRKTIKEQMGKAKLN
jgi:hypothetical protein